MLEESLFLYHKHEVKLDWLKINPGCSPALKRSLIEWDHPQISIARQ
jgi:hypothetical protein